MQLVGDKNACSEVQIYEYVSLDVTSFANSVLLQNMTNVIQTFV